MNGSLTAVGETVIQRVTYSIAGQAVAVRVSGDPEVANNGLFYIHSDHLGSTSVLTKYSDGYIVNSSLTRYTPFGGYRSGGPNQITDRAFTGQKENMALGLYYYNARYYAPSLGRFLSADTLVPDPQNPQSLNRYAYVLNRPLNLFDSTGHWECAADIEQNRCTQWVDEILNKLRDSGGDVSYGLYLWFMEYDQFWMSENGTGVVFEIVDGGNFDAQIPFCGGATGLCDVIQDPTIQLNRTILAGLPDKRMAALVGHEITHLYQRDINAFSTLGEMGAYYTQILLLEELGEIPGGAAQDAKNAVDSGTFDILDAQEAKSNLVNNYGYSPLLPIWPLWNADPDFYSLIVNPAQAFRTISVNDGISITERGDTP